MRKHPSAGESTWGRWGGRRLSVIELRRAGAILLLLLVILHAFQSLAGKVLKHNVVVIRVKFYEIGIYWSLVLWNFPMGGLLFGLGVH